MYTFFLRLVSIHPRTTKHENMLLDFFPNNEGLVVFLPSSPCTKATSYLCFLAIFKARLSLCQFHSSRLVFEERNRSERAGREKGPSTCPVRPRTRTSSFSLPLWSLSPLSPFRASRAWFAPSHRQIILLHSPVPPPFSSLQRVQWS